MTHYPRGPRLRVNVTKEAITKAISGDSSRCWIAESIKAAYPEATAVNVDLATTRFSDLSKGQRYVFITPFTAQLALIDFDEGRPPAPFTFLLRNAHVTKAGCTERKKKKDAEHRKKQHAKLHKQLLVGGDRKTGNLPRKIGGRRPPQLRHMRMFGIRAFRGLSLKRLAEDQDLITKAEELSK